MPAPPKGGASLHLGIWLKRFSSNQKYYLSVLAHEARPSGELPPQAAERGVFLIKTKIGARRWSSCMSRFCFSFAHGAVPITPDAAHRAMGANKNHGSPEKREWNGGIGVCAAMKAPVGLLSHKAVLRKQDGAAPPRQTWGLCTLHKPVFHRRFCRSICFSGAT